MNKKIALVAAGSAALGGLGVGYLVVGPMAHADKSTVVQSAAAPVAVTGASGATAPTQLQTRLESVLAPLVSDGTITQSQADQVIGALVQARANGTLGLGRGSRRAGLGAQGAQVAAKAIGITVAQLRSALQSGQSIAQVAAAHNVSADSVIAAMVADATTRIDAAVTKGTLTSDQAATLKANLNAKITARVNQVGPVGGRFGRHHHGQWGGAPGQDPTSPTSVPAASTQAPTAAPAGSQGV
jgi:ribosomal protein S20